MTDTARQPAITLVCSGLVGTLVADDGLIERSFAEAIATQGVVAGTSAYARRMTQVHQARGQAPADVLATLFPDNEARAQAALLAFHRALADGIRRTDFVPLPGVIAALDQLAGADVGVCAMSSLPRQAMDAIVLAAGLRRRLRGFLSAEDVARGFPAPDLPLTALMRCAAGAVQEIAVVHSTGAGVESGVRSGAGLVAGVITGPHPAARLRAAGAGRVLGSFADVPRALQSAGAGTGVASAAAAAGQGPEDEAQARSRGLMAAPISIPAQLSGERRPLGS